MTIQAAAPQLRNGKASGESGRHHDHETLSRYLLTDVKQPAKPKLNEVLRLNARLGGVLGRKSDGEPGVKTIWLGLKEVHVAAKTLRGLRAIDDDGSCV